MIGTGEAYFDIVWRQFRKNRIAYRLVWVILALFGVAIFAPVLASNQPYWFTDPEGLRSPWLVSLVNAETAIDFVFNLALLIFFPWAAGAWLMNREARKGGGPTLIEAKTYRWREHVGPNFDIDLGYRTQAELSRWMAKDPVTRLARRLLRAGVLPAARRQALEAAVEAEVADAVAFARSSPFPEPESLYADVD